MAEHITCREVVELTTGYLEHALPGAEATLFEHHIAYCDACTFYLDQMRATLAGAGRIAEADVPEPMREALLTAFRERRR